MSKMVFSLILAFLLTACAGKVTSIEYDHGQAVKAVEIYFMVAPAPMPVDARPPAFGNLDFQPTAY